MLFGVWVAIFLFLGLPDSWHSILAIITGVCIIITAYSLRAEGVDTKSSHIPYVEHKADHTAAQKNESTDGPVMTEVPSSPQAQMSSMASAGSDITSDNPTN